MHQNLLFYVVCAWEEDFTGSVIDYGAWPDPQRPYFTLQDATQTLSTMAVGTGLEGAIYAGLERLTDELLRKAWLKESGTPHFIERCLVDANWGTSTEVVYRFCRQCAFPSVMTPSHGRFIGAGSKALNDYDKKLGDRVGWNWRIPATTDDRPVRHVIFDSNFWKSSVQARLAMSIGDKGSLTLFGETPTRYSAPAKSMPSTFGMIRDLQEMEYHILAALAVTSAFPLSSHCIHPVRDTGGFSCHEGAQGPRPLL